MIREFATSYKKLGAEFDQYKAFVKYEIEDHE